MIVACFMVSGFTAALGGIMLYGVFQQGLPGDGRRLSFAVNRRDRPGRNKCLGEAAVVTREPVVGVLLIVLLQSMLSVLQMPEAGTPDHLRRSSSRACSCSMVAARVYRNRDLLRRSYRHTATIEGRCFDLSTL